MCARYDNLIAPVHRKDNRIDNLPAKHTVEPRVARKFVSRSRSRSGSQAVEMPGNGRPRRLESLLQRRAGGFTTRQVRNPTRQFGFGKERKRPTGIVPQFIPLIGRVDSLHRPRCKSSGVDLFRCTLTQAQSGSATKRREASARAARSLVLHRRTASI
jgi:hypothetical protein